MPVIGKSDNRAGLGHVSRVPCEMPHARLPGHHYCFQWNWKMRGVTL